MPFLHYDFDIPPIERWGRRSLSLNLDEPVTVELMLCDFLS